MKLHSLHMHAFGPFAQDAHVDFDALGVDGLFLLHGQTGAGKTTVLDAVAFALFGRVPGARDDGRRLLSDHAVPGDTPSVTLEATIGGRRLRIVRSPDHLRAKRRGEGVTKVNAAGSLTWVDGSGPGLSRLAEIGEVVGRMLGMSADQFFQVVLLPQGEFARFLRAGTDDREALLEKLFETRRFGDLEEWLRDRARTSRVELEGKAQTVERLAGQIAVVVGTQLHSEPDIDWAQAHLDAARTEMTAAQGAVEQTLGIARAADGALSDARQVDEVVRRCHAAQTQLAALDAEQATIDEVVAMIDAARRAEAVRSVVDDQESALRERDRTTGARTAADTRLQALVEGARLLDTLSWPPGRDDRDVIEGAMDRWTTESGRLEPLERRAADLPELRRRVEETQRRRAETARRVASIEADLASAPERRLALEDALAAALAAGIRLPALRTAAEAAEAARAAHAQLARLDDEAQRTHAQLVAHSDRHNTARERVLDLRERRIAGMAAELSAGLRDGDPCAVCGAVRHPAPATTGAEHVGEGDEAAARAEEKACESDRAVSERAHAAVESDRTLWRERAGGRTRDEAVAEVDRLVSECTRVAEEARGESELRARIAAADSEVARQRAELSVAAAHEAEFGERATHLTRSVGELEAEIDAATDSVTTVAGRREELTGLCAALTAVRDARSAAAGADARAAAATARLETVLAGAGFDTAVDARAALRSPAELARCEQQVRRAADIRASARSTLEDPQVARVVGVARPDVDRLEQVRVAANTAATTAAARLATATKTVVTLEPLCAAFWSAVSVLAPAVARDAEVAGLADVVAGRGQNSRRMSLRSYVLAARLEEVIIAASVRLRQMSSGRYEFAHSDAAASRGRRSGLGIEVRDEFTGAVRSANTLSGGETFFASLALALGLADVVSAESGGRVLDTIFIDEGFGTLDPEALDLVMGVLDELRSGGRVVGVVSHVEEMRARIPAQLRVIRSEGGSALQMLGTAG